MDKYRPKLQGDAGLSLLRQFEEGFRFIIDKRIPEEQLLLAEAKIRNEKYFSADCYLR